jgi:predicted nucleic acid-binding Zn ribbon protein
MSRLPRPLAESLPPLKERLAPRTVLAEVQEGWEAAAGPEIARHCEPVSEKSGVVTVRCRSGVWAAELSMMSRQLLERLNEARGTDREVREIRFVVGAETQHRGV